MSVLRSVVFVEKGEQNKMKKSRSELEPYTPYECTVEVTRENVVKRRDLNFSIDCGT